ncbi:MAG: adenylosuccinate lyase [Candidatus Altiarchaeota archaeon]
MIHPMEERYGRDEVRRIFDEEAKLQKMLDVEAALVKAHAAVGNIPKKDAAAVARKANTRFVKVKRVKDIEKVIDHDVMAVVKALSEKCGSSGRYIHLGATSNDITDTALALQLKEYIVYLEKDLKDLKSVLIRQAGKHKKTVCVGRTHAQHAVPTTYGLKFAIWAAEVQRHMERLRECKERILVGQLTGAVGTQAALGTKGIIIQDKMMKELGLKPVLVSNQVIQRDRHAEFLLLLALIAETLNKIGTEIRNLQRTEIDEVAEGFGKKQVGSSTMPHKRNPIYAERICGLSRVIKADAVASLENIPLWHERDLTNSSSERIIIPETCILSDYILQLSVNLIGNLVFNHESIRRNLEMTQGRIMSESIMIELAKRGMDRQKAHELVRECAMESFHKKKPFGEVLADSRRITSVLSQSEIKRFLKPENYIGSSEKQIDNLIKKIG